MNTDTHFPCPRCNRPLEPTGIGAAFGEEFVAYQCDNCIVSAELFGERYELPYTFAVDARGRIFDPDEPPPADGIRNS
jgi:hypothetical protein